MLFKQLLGIFATTIAFVGFIPYFRDILRNKTKPHAFTWFVWFLLTFIAFFAQITHNAGPGAWSMGLSALLSFVIFLFSIVKGKKRIQKTDWASFLGAMISLVLWLMTKQPLYSVILVTLTDLLAFIPTIRKSYSYPHEETLSTFVLAGVKHTISLFALEQVSMVTALYPAYLVGANVFFVSLLLVRRKALSQPITPPAAISLH